MRGIVRELLCSDASEQTVRNCAMSVAGQCCFYRHAHEMISRLYPDTKNTPEHIEALADHITRFSLSALRSIASTAPSA